ncbi:MAG: hypothetical protein QXT73_08840 [Candidatus Methanomethylicaceae archaeon]
MPSKADILNALEEVYRIAVSEDADVEDLDEIARIAGEVLGYEVEEEEE